MTTRLGYRKSRRGCRRCKARRVKCDETDPECSKCTKHGVVCEYIRDVPIRKEKLQPPTKKSTTFPTPASPVHLPSPYSNVEEMEKVLEADARRALELRLLHHFMTIVTYTFPACDQQRFRDIWTIDAIRTGFQHPSLLNAILAISALHLLADQRSMTYLYARDVDQFAVDRLSKTAVDTATLRNEDLARVHRLYLNTAVRQQREAISNLTSSNTDAVFMTSLLLSYQALRLIPDQQSSSMYTPPVHWLRMCKAVASIAEAARPMIPSDSIMARLLSYLTEPDLRNETAMFNPAYRKPFETLLDWNRYPEPSLDPVVQNAYERTLAYVGGTYNALLNKEAPRTMIRRIICIGILIPTRFIELLEEGRPRALVILAHHLAISQAVEEHWWFHGVADRVVKGTQSILPDEWQWAMAWPSSMIR